MAATKATTAVLGKGAQQMSYGIKSIAKLSVKATQKAATSIATTGDLDSALDDALEAGAGRTALPKDQRDAAIDDGTHIYLCHQLVRRHTSTTRNHSCRRPTG